LAGYVCKKVSLDSLLLNSKSTLFTEVHLVSEALQTFGIQDTWLKF